MKAWLTNQSLPQPAWRLLTQWQDGWQSRSVMGRTLVYILKPRTPPTRVPVKTARRVWKGIRYSHRERYAMSFEVINESSSTDQPGKWVRILKKQVKLLETRMAGCVFLYGVGMEIFSVLLAISWLYVGNKTVDVIGRRARHFTHWEDCCLSS